MKGYIFVPQMTQVKTTHQLFCCDTQGWQKPLKWLKALLTAKVKGGGDKLLDDRRILSTGGYEVLKLS